MILWDPGKETIRTVNPCPDMKLISFIVTYRLAVLILPKTQKCQLTSYISFLTHFTSHFNMNTFQVFKQISNMTAENDYKFQFPSESHLIASKFIPQHDTGPKTHSSSSKEQSPATRRRRSLAADRIVNIMRSVWDNRPQCTCQEP